MINICYAHLKYFKNNKEGKYEHYMITSKLIVILCVRFMFSR